MQLHISCFGTIYDSNADQERGISKLKELKELIGKDMFFTQISLF